MKIYENPRNSVKFTEILRKSETINQNLRKIKKIIRQKANSHTKQTEVPMNRPGGMREAVESKTPKKLKSRRKKSVPREHDHEQRLEIPHNLAQFSSKKVVFEPSYGRLSARA